MYSCEPVFSQVGATYAPFVHTVVSVKTGNVAVSLCELSLSQILSAVPVSVCVGFFVMLQAPQICVCSFIVILLFVAILFNNVAVASDTFKFSKAKSACPFALSLILNSTDKILPALVNGVIPTNTILILFAE